MNIVRQVVRLCKSQEDRNNRQFRKSVVQDNIEVMRHPCHKQDHDGTQQRPASNVQLLVCHLNRTISKQLRVRWCRVYAWKRS